MAAEETGRYFSNAVAEFILEEGASLRHGSASHPRPLGMI